MTIFDYDKVISPSAIFWMSLETAGSPLSVLPTSFSAILSRRWIRALRCSPAPRYMLMFNGRGVLRFVVGIFSLKLILDGNVYTDYNCSIQTTSSIPVYALGCQDRQLNCANKRQTPVVAGVPNDLLAKGARPS